MTLVRQPLRRGTAVPLLLDYVDAMGERTTRRVIPVAIVGDPSRRRSDSTYLQARCVIAKAVRSFRFDRIVQLSDPETGEVLEPADWAEAQTLGDGRAFAWDEEEQEDEAPTADAPVAQPPVARRWRTTLILVIAGYGIGRLRIIHMVLVALKIRHGLWL